jgi:hypothetical protein
MQPQDKVCAALTEQLMGLFAEDTLSQDFWAAAWEEFSSLPRGVRGTSRQVRGGAARRAASLGC